MKYRGSMFIHGGEIKGRQTTLWEFDWKKMFRKEIEDMEAE